MMVSFLSLAFASVGKLRLSTKSGSSSGSPLVTLTIHFSLPTLMTATAVGEPQHQATAASNSSCKPTKGVSARREIETRS